MIGFAGREERRLRREKRKPHKSRITSERATGKAASAPRISPAIERYLELKAANLWKAMATIANALRDIAARQA
jgi:hypothetical protein